MSDKKLNLLVIGLLKTGSSALIDMLREYDNVALIPNEFDEYRAPGLVADQLASEEDKLPNLIHELTRTNIKLRLIYNILPIFNLKQLKNIEFGARFFSTLKQLKRLSLLKRLNKKLKSGASSEEKVEFAKNWIREVGNIYEKGEYCILYNQPLQIVNEIKIWKQVFHPFKLIVVFRDPKDQLADIIKFRYLFGTYGDPYMTLSNFTLESIYGRSRAGAIKFHINAIKKRVIVLILYIIAGPTYIRTRPTSSLIRFIRSPVLFFL